MHSNNNWNRPPADLYLGEHSQKNMDTLFHGNTCTHENDLYNSYGNKFTHIFFFLFLLSFLNLWSAVLTCISHNEMLSHVEEKSREDVLDAIIVAGSIPRASVIELHFHLYHHIQNSGIDFAIKSHRRSD